jgi:hypothetical protein
VGQPEGEEQALTGSVDTKATLRKGMLADQDLLTGCAQRAATDTVSAAVAAAATSPHKVFSGVLLLMVPMMAIESSKPVTGDIPLLHARSCIGSQHMWVFVTFTVFELNGNS